jgi:transglutaminase-like putative cysteine protease
MPGWTEIARYLHVSTFKDWDAVGRWYWNLVREQLVVDAKIKAAVQEVLKGLPKGADERAKVRALYKHVITSTRYVGLEFGIHGFKPYRTTDVYDRRFGDCKDKASLLKVMLAEAGIASHLVLVRTRDQGTVTATPASLPRSTTRSRTCRASTSTSTAPPSSPGPRSCRASTRARPC